MSNRKRKAAAHALESGWARLAVFSPIVVALVTFAAFSPVLSNEFVAWDDDKNFLDNVNYRGLGLTQLRWMWTTFHLGHYVPLSWMSLGFDYVVWGMNPTGYHLTNLLLHSANAVLVYFVARRLLVLAGAVSAAPSTARDLLPAAAALLFSVHPLRVESVAWATERRDVLSCCFMLLSVLSYLRSRDGTHATRWYGAAIAAFVCALLSKGSAVVLPPVLLLLNVFPLKRLGGGAGWWSESARRVCREVLPFALVATASAAMTLVALQNIEPLSRSSKLAVSVYSLAFYVSRTIAPFDLSPLYAMPDHINLGAAKFAASYILVFVLCAVVWINPRRSPALVVGWSAFVIVLLPLLGFVQNGPQIAADRYTYTASIALAVLAAAGLSRLARPVAVSAVVAVVVLTLALLTRRQTSVWRDSSTLWARVLEVEPDSPIGLNNWANLLVGQGKLSEAIESYERAVRLSPRYAEAQNNLGVALVRAGRAGDAVDHYRRALAINPVYADAQNNWGIAAVQQGNTAEAMEHYRLALAINPASADAHTNWGNALVRLGRPGDAVQHYEDALIIKPDHADAHHNWGVALARQGKMAEAIEQFRQAISINPNHAEAKEYLARALQLTPHL